MFNWNEKLIWIYNIYFDRFKWFNKYWLLGQEAQQYSRRVLQKNNTLLGINWRFKRKPSATYFTTKNRIEKKEKKYLKKVVLYTGASGRESYKGAVRSNGEKTCWDLWPFFLSFSLLQPWPRKRVLYTTQAQNPKTTFDPNDNIVALHYVARCPYKCIRPVQQFTSDRRSCKTHGRSRPQHSTTIRPSCKSADFDVCSSHRYYIIT